MKRCILFALPLWVFAFSFPLFAQEEVQVRRKSMFLRGDETSLIDAKDAGLLGRLGNAVGGAISEDRSQATLKNREKIYHFTHLDPGQRVDHTYYVLETGAWVNPYNLKEADLISQNWFAGKYLDPMGGGGTGYGETLVRDFSTRGKPYIVLTPAGKDDYYFSYEAFANTGGIRTVINPHFVKDETVVDVTPLEHVTSCADIHTEIMKFPAMPNPGTSAYYCWYYTYGWYLKKHIKQCVYTRLKCNTETYVNAEGDLHPDELKITLTVDGYKKSTLDGIAAAKDVKIGNPGDADVTRVVVLDKNTVEVYFKPATLTTGEKKIIFGGKEVFKRLRFIKVIHDVPDTAVGIKKFAGFRLGGTLTKEPITMKSTGKSIVFADQFYQCWTFSGTRFTSPTEATSCTVGGDNDAFDYVTCGTTPDWETFTPRNPHLPISTCLSQANVCGIKSIRWVAKDSPLDNNLGNIVIPGRDQIFLGGGGMRMFPDKQSPDDRTTRSTVNVVAEISARPGTSHTLYLKSFDVDDPSSHRTVVDDEQTAWDNRGNPVQGAFIPQGDDQALIKDDPRDPRELNKVKIMNVTVNGDGVGIATVRFQVSMQPGDNYKVIGVCGNKDLWSGVFAQAGDDQSRLYKRFPAWIIPEMYFNASKGGVKEKQEEPAQITLDLSRVKGVLSTVLLTVWRKLHIEMDSMEEEPRPSTNPDKKSPDIQKIVVLNVAINAPNNGQTTLTVDRISGVTDQHEGGLIWVGDWTLPDIMADVIANGSGRRVSVVINGVLTPAGIARITGATDVWITDDDNPQKQLPYYPPIHQEIINVLAQAYIFPEEISPDNPKINVNRSVPFLLNINAFDFTVGLTPTDDAKDVATGDPAYWVNLLTTCYQFALSEDGDPDQYTDNRRQLGQRPGADKASVGASTHTKSTFYRETIHDLNFKPIIPDNERYYEALTIVHELVHGGGIDEHEDSVENIMHSNPGSQTQRMLDKHIEFLRGDPTW